ncbi:Os05g0230501, partial [Oryza sativa Japonica Group]
GEDGAREEGRRDGGGEVSRSRLAEDGGQRWRARPLDAPLRHSLSRSISLLSRVSQLGTWVGLGTWEGIMDYLDGPF